MWLRKMPPSHQLKFSPSRDRRPATTHRRGLSFESGLAVKAKDDDLALFTDMQNRERSNFLLHTSDDFDESICNACTHSVFTNSILFFLAQILFGYNTPGALKLLVVLLI